MELYSIHFYNYSTSVHVFITTGCSQAPLLTALSRSRMFHRAVYQSRIEQSVVNYPIHTSFIE